MLLRPLAVALSAAASFATSTSAGNVLLLVADDLGVERMATYAVGDRPATTPNLDALAASGVQFQSCWANPYCSPTRATIFTGEYSFRTGVGFYVNPFADPTGLPSGRWTLPKALAQDSGGAVHAALIGKWHLGSYQDGIDHPIRCGFDAYTGAPNNLILGQDYYDWIKVFGGVQFPWHVYATTDAVDDALAAIASFGADRWFLTVSFHAPHSPFHAPPAHLHTEDLEGDPKDTPAQHVKATIEAMDTEIGRLLASIDPQVLADTTVIFVADNGTEGLASETPIDPKKAKGTLYEGGVRVPLIVAGPGVPPGATCDALVNTTDLFATILDLLPGPSNTRQAPKKKNDSVSLAPYLADPSLPSARDWIYAEVFSPNHARAKTRHERAIRGERFKLIFDVLTDERELYDLEADPFEAVNLLDGELTDEIEAAYTQLNAQLAALVGTE